MATVEETAWAAGLFQGSGSTGFYRSRTAYQLRAQLQLTSDNEEARPDALDRFFRAVDRLGKLENGSAYGPNRRCTWPWVAINDQAEQVIERFLPYLYDHRREKAIEALAEYRGYRTGR